MRRGAAYQAVLVVGVLLLIAVFGAPVLAALASLARALG